MIIVIMKKSLIAELAASALSLSINALSPSQSSPVQQTSSSTYASEIRTNLAGLPTGRRTIWNFTTPRSEPPVFQYPPVIRNNVFIRSSDYCDKLTTQHYQNNVFMEAPIMRLEIPENQGFDIPQQQLERRTDYYNGLF